MTTFKITRFGEVTSTNDIAKNLAEDGAPEGTVIIADKQTKGRGRMGRSFLSPEGTGLYMSIILRPEFEAECALLITTAAAVAVAKAIEKHSGKNTALKWVNDVYIGTKKVSGILTEGKLLQNGRFEYAVLGIGVNLRSPKSGFGTLESIAGAVFDNIDFDREKFECDLLENFFEYYKNLSQKPHFDDYIARDMLRGKEVSVMRAGEILYSASVCGIDRDFSLLIERNGKKENLASGEVSVKCNI
ncbi:MAG: biotin--[Clostridia bacterium]|nr:biotin--[acetyl-CoA-carboxylase] ligase [Clostridia bacterium]